MRNRTCGNMAEIAEVFNHNTEVFAKEIDRLNKRIRKLEKRNRFVWIGILLGAVIELSFLELEQNQKIAGLEKEVRELKDREGD